MLRVHQAVEKGVRHGATLNRPSRTVPRPKRSAKSGTVVARNANTDIVFAMRAPRVEPRRFQYQRRLEAVVETYTLMWLIRWTSLVSTASEEVCVSHVAILYADCPSVAP
jgi:hypothetical protein